MKIRTESIRRNVVSAAGVLAFAASGCNGELAVLDDTLVPDAAGAGSSGPSMSSGGGQASGAAQSNAPCGCASGDTLMALGCDVGPGAITGLSGKPHTTADGQVAAFGVCYDDAYEGDCTVLHWRAATGAQRAYDFGVVNGLSAGGDTVLVGTGTESLLVQVHGGVSSLPIIPFYFDALSPEGGFVMGYDAIQDDIDSVHLARWTSDSRTQRLGELSTNARSDVRDATPDAETFVGVVEEIDNGRRIQPFRASVASGVQLGLGELPAGATEAWPDAVSADGAVIAGVTTGLGSIFRWTEATGIVEIAAAASDPPVGLLGHQAMLSEDGTVVAATRAEPRPIGASAFRWTEATGAVALIPGAPSSVLFMSDDGSVVVGDVLEGGVPRTFVWDAVHGARVLQTTLESLGVDVSGWEIGEPRTLSANGNVLMGVGTCGGVPTTYRIVLPE
jgi:hypothetical protein